MSVMESDNTAKLIAYLTEKYGAERVDEAQHDPDFREGLARAAEMPEDVGKHSAGMHLVAALGWLDPM